jgi:hypothetical protein
VAARKRALLKKQTWEEFFAKHGERNAKPYEFRDSYRENAIVFHPKFGKGYVSEVVSESKIEITFSDARRILVHNRKDIPGSPVGREDDGLPSTIAPMKTGGKGAAKAVGKQVVKAAVVPPKAAPAVKAAPVPKTAPAPKALAPTSKVPAKQVVEEKKVPAKKPAEQKQAAKKSPVAKKTAVKKAPAAKNPIAKKPVAKKPVAKKPVAKKPVVKKPAKKKSK